MFIELVLNMDVSTSLIIGVIIGLVIAVPFIWFLVKPNKTSSNLDINEIKAQISLLITSGSQSQKNISDTLSNSMANLSDRLNLRLTDQTAQTAKELSEMQKKLAIIDSAQKNLTELTQQVTGLQNILSNKQSRGSFGEVQLENIVNDSLPKSSFEFQHTLSNNKRVDCLVKMPGPPGNICIDSKFPLEAWKSYLDSKNEDDRTLFLKKLNNDVEKHIKDIAEKYIIPGETADSAVMFLPSESIYAGINLHLPNCVSSSRKNRVFMAGPDNLMLLLHTVRAILRDASMSEAASTIQVEVAKIMDDIVRLDERVNKLATHFAQAQSDLNSIQTSSKKIISRGQKINEIEVEK